MSFARNLTAERVLSGTRLRVLDAILENPGCCTTEILKLTDTAMGQALFHVQVLEHFGYVHTIRQGRYRRHYPTSLVSPAEAATDAVLANPKTGPVYNIVRTRPGSNQSEIAAAFPDRTRQTVGYHLGRLIEVGAVSARRDGKSVRYHPLSVSSWP